MNKLLILIIILGLAYGVYQWQSGVYSKEVLKLEILGPTETALAQEIEYIIKYKNNGDFRLEEPELVFEAPSSSLKDRSLFQLKTFNSEELGGAIYPGEERNISIKIRLLGQEGDIKMAKASLSYRPKDLKARYESSTSFSTQITSAPLTLSFDLPSNTGEGQNFDFKLNYYSNVDYPLTDLRCQVDYPFGFEFVTSSPSALERTDWIISVLNKSEGGSINITGNLSGNINDVKIFNAKIGIWKEDQFIILKEVSKGVEIIKPSLYLQQEINGNPEHIVSVDELLRYEIYFKNVGEKALTNLFMVSQFEDSLLDFTTMNSSDGDYQEGDNSIVFDWRKNSKLQYLSPLEEGKVEFWIRVKEDLGNIQNPVIKNSVFIGQTVQNFTSKIKSVLEVNQKAYYASDIFESSGPLPPEVGEETTYTIVWNPKTYYSDIENAKVRTFLPDNVDLTGGLFPEEELENFTFNSQSREIVWSLGDLKRDSENVTLVFQVKLKPDSSQRNDSAIILNETTMTGYDVWTETSLESLSSSLDTSSIEDFEEGLGVVK